MSFFFPKESFNNKVTFNSHSFKKINDFVATHYATTIFSSTFYLNPFSRTNKNRVNFTTPIVRSNILDSKFQVSSIVKSILLMFIITTKK